jgi:uncharacterized Zn finger protein (UPF0148 family)
MTIGPITCPNCQDILWADSFDIHEGSIWCFNCGTLVEIEGEDGEG